MLLSSINFFIYDPAGLSSPAILAFLVTYVLISFLYSFIFWISFNSYKSLSFDSICVSNNFISLEKGKVIDNFECYIATVVDSDEAKQAEVGKKIKIRLPNSKEVDAKIKYIGTDGDDTVLVLRIQDYVEELTSYRKISFDIIWWSASGLKVPNTAIVYENDIACVVRQRAGYLEKVYVKILKQNDKYSIVSNYSSDELESLGFDLKQMGTKKSINMYDEVLVNITDDKFKSIK